MTTFLYILQNQVSRSPRMKEWGWLTCFPFFGLLIPSTMNHWQFPVYFSQELKFSSTFRKHDLNKQGAFWPYFLVHRSVWVSTWGCGLPFWSLAHISTPSLCLCLIPLHIGHTLFSFTLSLRTKFELASSLTSLRSVLWQALKGVLRTFSHWNSHWQQGWRDISWWMISIGECHEANEMAGISLCPTSSGTDEWILNGHTEGQNIQDRFWPLPHLTSSAC